MKIRPGEALRNEIILQGNCQTHLFLLQEAQCKLFQALFWLGKKSPRKGKLIICSRQKKKSSVCYTGITAPFSWRSVSMTTMVDRCSHTMRQKSFTVLAIGP